MLFALRVGRLRLEGCGWMAAVVGWEGQSALWLVGGGLGIDGLRSSGLEAATSTSLVSKIQCALQSSADNGVISRAGHGEV